MSLVECHVLRYLTSTLCSIPYNPVFFSYAAVTPESATLYIDSSKLSSDVKSYFGDKVKVRPYDAIFEDSRALSQSAEAKLSEADGPKPKFLISTKASWALSLDLGGEEKVEEVRSPIGDEGMRACHIRDGAALSKYFAWLEEELVAKGTKLDEVQAADKLEELRS